MTRVEATRKLAEKVMGVKTPPNIPWRDGSDYLLESKPLVAWYNEPDNYPCIDVFASCSPMAICWKFGDAAKPYSPWTNTQQALDLAEAWCELDKQHPWSEDVRYYVYHRAGRRSHEVILYEKRGYEDWWGPHGRVAETTALSLAAALTGAVCKAKGIKVKDAR